MKTKVCMLLIGLLSIGMVGMANAVTFEWKEMSNQPVFIDGSITFDDTQWLAGGYINETGITSFSWSVDNGNGLFDFASLIPSAYSYTAKFNTETMVVDGTGFQLNIDAGLGHGMYVNDLTWKAMDDWSGWGEANGFGYWIMTDPPAPVPEPASMLLLGSGLLGLALFRKKRKA